MQQSEAFPLLTRRSPPPQIQTDQPAEDDGPGSSLSPVESPVLFGQAQQQGLRVDLHFPGLTPRVIHTPQHTLTPTARSQISGLFSTPEQRSASPRGRLVEHSSGRSTPVSMASSHTSQRATFSSLPQTPTDASTRMWYDDFTTIDWVHDFIKESFRVKWLREQPGIRGRLQRMRYASQGWILVSIIASCVAVLAYGIESSQARIFDWREGYCSTKWYAPQYECCADSTGTCPAWVKWNVGFSGAGFLDYGLFIVSSVILAVLAVSLTLTTATNTPFLKTRGRGQKQPESTNANIREGAPVSVGKDAGYRNRDAESKTVMYTAAGGGVVQVKTILSGFVIKKFLGSYTLLIKSIALVLAISSGLNVGKEGPYVHMAACVGNIACRLFSKFRDNDGKRREIISAATAAGVAVAFGSPLGGVLFALEEVSYYFPQKTLFRSFLCAVISALVLKFLNPYGTGKIVIFEVSYSHDWYTFEFFVFVFIGVCGGVLGALIGVISTWWGKRVASVRSKHPILEVVGIAAVTAAVSYFNVYTKKAPTELLYDLARQCTFTSDLPGEMGLENSDILCPYAPGMYSNAIWSLVVALVIKLILTSMSTGLTIPSGLYVPSMVIGALFGRMIGLLVQLLQYHNPDLFLFSSCPAGSSPQDCTISGVYALVGAGAVMAGVTRMTVTLAVILFEITGSLDHVLPISVAILVAKWVAQILEPESIYDIIMHVNNFPFLDNQRTPGFSSTLREIVPKATISATSPVIDVTDSPYISASVLRTKLNFLQMAGEFDGSLPILRAQVLVGLLPGPELEFALDKIKESTAASNSVSYSDLTEIEDSDEPICHISADEHEVQQFYLDRSAHHREYHKRVNARDISGGGGQAEATASDATSTATTSVEVVDLTPFVDRAPISLDINSPLAMVHLLFVKMGLRMVCVMEDGKFWGVLHKKRFIEYCRFGEDNMTTWF
ncbi:CLC channel [Myxozyma melibiosi]|uniref:CLC channel n=1 Tax=Myxozyma melibiosi TaxID=54550 RepID=A0ABR1F7W5_9ASCO